MKFLSALIIFTLMFVAAMSQAPMAPMAGMPPQQNQQPNLFQMMLYRNMFDMNWLHALLFSNGFGGTGGTGAGGSSNIMPWLIFGNMM